MFDFPVFCICVAVVTCVAIIYGVDLLNHIHSLNSVFSNKEETDMVSELYDLSKRFQSLKEDINGTEPTVERCRDWAELLVNMCEDLTLCVRELATAQRKRENYEAEQAEYDN